MLIENPMEKIIMVRKHRNYSQSQMAELLGITQASWGRKESGKIHGFSFDDISKILNFLNVDSRWIFGQLDCSMEDALLDNKKSIFDEQKAYNSGDIESMKEDEISKTLNKLEDSLVTIERERNAVLRQFEEFKQDFYSKKKKK